MSDFGKKCFACDRAFRLNSWGNIAYHPEAITIDGQLVYVGHDCFKKIQAAEREGYQPPLGGPRLWADQYAPEEALRAAGITITRSQTGADGRR